MVRRKTDAAQEDQELSTDAPGDDPAPTDTEDTGASSSAPAASLSEEVVRAALHAALSGGPVARDTVCWNAVQAAIPGITAHINRHLPQEG